MNRMKPLVLSVCLLGVLFALPAAAGDTEKPAMEFFAVEVATVKPPMVNQYEKVTRDMVAAMTAAKADSPSYFFWASSGPSMTYTFVTPIENFAALDAMEADWLKLADLVGKETFRQMWIGATQAVDHLNRFVIVKLPGLSYEPETPGDVESKAYHSYGFFYVAQDQEMAFRKLVAAFVDLSKKKKVPEPFQVYSVVMGDDLPLYISVSSARNQPDFLAARKHVKELLGEEGKALSEKIVATLRKYERREGWFRKDLSYVPPSMQKKK